MDTIDSPAIYVDCEHWRSVPFPGLDVRHWGQGQAQMGTRSSRSHLDEEEDRCPGTE
jgi:hypothetical protein